MSDIKQTPPKARGMQRCITGRILENRIAVYTFILYFCGRGVKGNMTENQSKTGDWILNKNVL